jgi:hypothetical protein
MSIEKIAEKIGGTGGGGLGTMKVTMDADGRFASKSGAEISAHVAAGGDAVLDEAWGQIMLTKCIQGIIAVFEYLQGNSIVTIEIDENRNLTKHFTQFATTDQIGEISSALDELHAYAQALIAGGAS